MIIKKMSSWMDPDYWFGLLSHLPSINCPTIQNFLVDNGVFLDSLSSSTAMTFFSEFGDSTWFIAMLLAAGKNSRGKVFAGALAANILMIIIAAFIGNTCLVAIPNNIGQITGSILFLYYGTRFFLQSFEGKDPEEKSEDLTKNAKQAIKSRRKNISSGGTGTFALAFALTFFGELGDRSQITTLILAAKEEITGVVVGCILAQSICLAVAVCCGKAIAQKISYNKMSVWSGILFMLYGAKTVSVYLTHLIK